jgi:hypothetical protein
MIAGYPRPWETKRTLLPTVGAVGAESKKITLFRVTAACERWLGRVPRRILRQRLGPLRSTIFQQWAISQHIAMPPPCRASCGTGGAA